MTVPKLLSVEEVAAAARSPCSTVRYWLYSGRLESVKAGRHRLVPEPALLRFLELSATGEPVAPYQGDATREWQHRSDRCVADDGAAVNQVKQVKQLPRVRITKKSSESQAVAPDVKRVTQK